MHICQVRAESHKGWCSAVSSKVLPKLKTSQNYMGSPAIGYHQFWWCIILFPLTKWFCFFPIFRHTQTSQSLWVMYIENISDYIPTVSPVYLHNIFIISPLLFVYQFPIRCNVYPPSTIFPITTLPNHLHLLRVAAVAGHCRLTWAQWFKFV